MFLCFMWFYNCLVSFVMLVSSVGSLHVPSQVVYPKVSCHLLVPQPANVPSPLQLSLYGYANLSCIAHLLGQSVFPSQFFQEGSLSVALYPTGDLS